MDVIIDGGGREGPGVKEDGALVLGGRPEKDEAQRLGSDGIPAPEVKQEPRLQS